MAKISYQTLAIDIMAVMSTRQKESSFSYQNQQLLINGNPVPFSSSAWPDSMRTSRAKYFLEKVGLTGLDLEILGSLWMKALQKGALSVQQLKKMGLSSLSTPSTTDNILSHWRRMLEARLLESMPDLDYIEQLSLADFQKIEQPLELAPLLHTWPDRLLNHPEWSCTEPPLPEIPPLPLDKVWVDLHVTEPLEDNNVEDGLLSQAMEQRYRESQWVNMPADFVLESLTGTMVLVGTPGIGKTTLMKWIARRLIQQSEGRFLLPLFIPLRAYALKKAQDPTQDLLEFSLHFCGVKSKEQIEKWSTVISYLSGTGRNTVLLLLDGWDEVPQGMRETLISEIQGLGYGFSIIITSRPSAYPKALPADQFYEISDLPPENIVTLIRQWHELMHQPHQADILLAHLRKHPDLLRLVRNPFLLNLLCAINREDKANTRKLPRNRTELYTSTLEYIYNYQSRKYPAAPFTRNHIQQTQKLALWLLSESPNHPQYLFGSQEVEQITKDTDLLPKVLSPSRLLSQWHIDKESLHFLHTTFQEYLAAEALLEQDKETRISLIMRELHNPAWQEILRFMAGKQVDISHDFWHIIRQLAHEPDQCGLIDIRLSQLIAETEVNDGGKALLGYDLRERLWKHIKSGIGTNYFVQAYAQLDAKNYVKRVSNTKSIRSKALKARLIRSLGKILTKQSSHSLVTRLLSGNKADAAVASYAVKDVLDGSGIQKLRHKIQDETLAIETRQILVRALGNCKDYTSIPFLIKFYKTSPELRNEILRALGSIGGKESADALEEILQVVQDVEHKRSIINALGRAFDLPARDVLMAQLARIMPNDSVLEDILEALCEIPISRHSDLISVYLDNTFSENIRVQAIWALMEATETHITEKLAHLGESDCSEKVRITALAALRKRARSFDLAWLSNTVKNEAYRSVERANALEAIFGLYKRTLQGLTCHFDSDFLHEQILELTKFSLRQPSSDINVTAAVGAYLLGKDIAPILLSICENNHEFSDSVRESACTSLGKIRYKPALALLISWIEKSSELLDDEEEPLIAIDDRLARAAAQAFVQIDLQSAAMYPTKTVQAAVGKFALENSYLIFSDRILTPAGKILEQDVNKEKLSVIHSSLKLDPDKDAFAQKEKLKKVCQYLLANGHAHQTSRYPNKKPFALFNKSNDAYFSNGINANTGRNLLKGENISPQSATMLMDRLYEKFKFVFIN